MRTITGTISSTPIDWLSALSNIDPPNIRRQSKLLALYRKVSSGEDIPLKNDFVEPVLERLKSRHPAITRAKTLLATDFNPKEVWKKRWSNSGLGSNLFEFDVHSSRSEEFTLPRKIWCNLNRLRTGHGRCNQMLHKWKMIANPSCDCGDS